MYYKYIVLQKRTFNEPTKATYIRLVLVRLLSFNFMNTIGVWPNLKNTYNKDSICE